MKEGGEKEMIGGERRKCELRLLGREKEKLPFLVS